MTTILKLTQREQILLRPSTHLGEPNPIKCDTWVCGEGEISENIVCRKEVVLSEALNRLFIEILSNAIDNVWRSSEAGIHAKKIDVSINSLNGVTEVSNDGRWISVKKYKNTEEYEPYVIFGQLNSSSNYDDKNLSRMTSGTNGFGSKLVNIFAYKFEVEVKDPELKKVYKQTWQSNMSACSSPSIKDYKPAANSTGYTRITWIPDFARFGGMKGYTLDSLNFMRKCVLDVAMIVAKYGVKVSLNVNNSKESIPLTPKGYFLDYVKLYQDVFNEENFVQIKTKDCDVILTSRDDSRDFQSVGFVNGINVNHGAHVDQWIEALLRPIVDKLSKKLPSTNLGSIKKYMAIFISCYTINAKFVGGNMKSSIREVSLEIEVPSTVIAKIMKWDFVENIKDAAELKDNLKLNKSSSKKIVCSESLDDAGYVRRGVKKEMKKCILTIVEGNSARNLITAGAQYGIEGVSGREYIGILTLRGKILNPRDKSAGKISSNKVAMDLITSINVKTDIDYRIEENRKDLRYGRVLISVDGDVDGSHICSLLYNFFEIINSTLLQIPNFFSLMKTPILVVRNAKGKIANEFYNENVARKFIIENKINFNKINRFKGLGSIERKDVPDIFGKKIVIFEHDNLVHDKLNKVFGKNNAAYRKSWLSEENKVESSIFYNAFSDCPGSAITITVNPVQYFDLELIEYSRDHCRRAIPNLLDGLNESQRKIMYSCFLKNLTTPIRVSQLAGYVSQKTLYAHGEENLVGVTSKMAQDFVSTNNLNLLFPQGSFGSRDSFTSASGRYIYTFLHPVTRHIFKILDECYLENRIDEGILIEKEFYMPIIPMCLVNGSDGIATGFSTFTPCFNPNDLIEWIVNWLNKIDVSKQKKIRPWYRGFKGKIVEGASQSYNCYGVIKQISSKSKFREFEVSEIPVGKKNISINDYIFILTQLQFDRKIGSFRNYSTDNDINFIVTEGSESEAIIIDLSSEKSTEKALSELKLVDSVYTSNMTFFSDINTIKKFDTVEDIIQEFCVKRLSLYKTRISGEVKKLGKLLNIAESKLRFITEVNSNKIIIINKEEVEIYGELNSKKFFKNLDEDSEENEDGIKCKGYSYLLNLKFSSSSKTKLIEMSKDIEKLKKEIEEYNKTTPEKIWKKELGELSDFIKINLY